MERLYLKYLTDAILELIGLVDAGESTDPVTTWRHVEDGTVWAWLAGLYRAKYGPYFLFGFVPGSGAEAAIWEDGGLKAAFALSEGRCVRGMARRRNGLCLLVEMIDFLITDEVWEKEPPRAKVARAGGGIWD